MSMFNDISWGSKDNEKECELSAQLVSLYAKRFSPGQWSLLGPGSENKWYSTHEYNPQGEWDRVAEQMMITFAESRRPLFQSSSRSSRGVLKSKGGGKLSIHFCADGDTIETLFAQLFPSISSVSTEQSQIYVKNVKLAMSEQDDLLWRNNQTHFCADKLDNDTQTFDWDSWTRKSIAQVPRKRVESKIKRAFGQWWSCPQRSSIAKIRRTNWKVITTRQGEQFLYWCRIPGNSWSRTVLHDKPHWRILTIYRFSGLSWVHSAKRWKTYPEPKGWIRGNTKIWPVLEVTTSYPQVWSGNQNWVYKQGPFSLVGQNFLMAWISWSQTWSTRRTTTTSRKHLKRRRKYFAFASRSIG